MPLRGERGRRRPQRGVAPLVALFTFLFLFASVLRPVAAQLGVPILNYTVTEANVTGAIETAEEWMHYVDDVCNGPGSIVKQMEYYLQELLPLDVRTDFFYKTNVSLYASSLGFVTITNSPMCYSLCADTLYTTLFGFYQFTNDASKLQSLGGDWPVIALYLANISPRPPSGKICKSGIRGELSSAGVLVEWQTLEYVDFTNSVTGEGSFRGQMTIYTNGTIVFRYAHVPESFITSSTKLEPSVGLVLSKRQRIVASTPFFSGPQLIVKRFDPIRDTCAASLTAAACVSDSQCGWCQATNACVNTAVADEHCPQSYLQTSTSPATPTPGTAASFYDVSVTQNSCYRVITSEETYQEAKGLSLLLPIGFPFFGQNPSPAARAPLTYFSIGGYSVNSSASQDCNPMWGVCLNGNYTNAIVPFLTPLVSDAYGGTNPATRLVASTAGTKRILSSNAFRFAAYYGYSFVVNNLWYELYLDSSGNIEFLFGCEPVLTNPSSTNGSSTSDLSRGSSTSNGDGSDVIETYTPEVVYDYFSYPAAFVGLLRNTADDPASVLIPPLLIRTGTRVRFTLKTKCLPCGIHGVCDESTATCTCNAGFVGDQCDACAPGRFGPTCEACPTCNHGGRCSDGINGSGLCYCSPSYAGPTCAVECQLPSLCDADACLAAGHGYCDCTGCVCTDGYSGPRCNVPPRDPCAQLSLDGCPVCSERGPECLFCFDSYCYSPSFAVEGIGHACSRPIEGNFTQICRTITQPRLIGPDLGYVLLGALAAFVGILYVFVAVVIFYLVRYIRITHFDVHCAVAAGGLVDYKAVRREREIVQSQLVFEERAKERPHILGFVLHQISLKKLYKRQRGSERPPHDGSNDVHRNASGGR